MKLVILFAGGMLGLLGNHTIVANILVCSWHQTIPTVLQPPTIAVITSPDHGNADRLEAMAIFPRLDCVCAGDVDERTWVGMEAKDIVPVYSVAHFCD